MRPFVVQILGASSAVQATANRAAVAPASMLANPKYHEGYRYGYIDGFNSRAFRSDLFSKWGSVYSAGYTAGYADGLRDARGGR